MSKNKIDITKLKYFLEQLSILDLSFEKKVEEEIRIPDLTKFEKFIESYKDADQYIKKDRQRGLMLNVWQAANLGRNEVRNSKTLCWFLDRYADHGQKSLFLQEFLKCLPEPWKNIPLNQYRVTEESCPLGENSERVDIEIEADNFLLFIEVKIDAMEGERQLERYRNVAIKKSKGRQWGIVYLTKYGALPDNEYIDEHFLGLSWKNLAYHWRIFTKSSSKLKPDNRAIWLLEQFVEHISKF